MALRQSCEGHHKIEVAISRGNPPAPTAPRDHTEHRSPSDKPHFRYPGCYPGGKTASSARCRKAPQDLAII